MTAAEAREFLKPYSPEQIRYIAARLTDQSMGAPANVQAGVKLLVAVALVWLDEREGSE